MDWIQVITIIASVIGVMVYFLQRIEKDINATNKRLDKMDARFDGHAQRIDQLYKMFVDLLQARK